MSPGRHMPTTTSTEEPAVGQAQLAGQARVLELIARGAPLVESMTLLLELRERLVPGMRSSIVLLDDDGVHFRHLAAPRLPPAYVTALDGLAIGPDTGACGTAMHARRPVFCEDIATSPLWEDYRELALPWGLSACWSIPILDPGGAVLGSFACYFDEPRRPTTAELQMTESTVQIASIAISRERELRRLRESEAALNAAQRVAHMGSYELDVRSGRGQWSRELFRLLGRDPALGVPGIEQFHRQYLHPEDSPRLAEAHARAVRTGEPFTLELRSHPQAGPQRIFTLTAQPLAEASGGVSRIIGTMTDITDRRALVMAARESAARLTLAVRAAQVELFEWDLDRRRVLFSPEFKRRLGYGDGPGSDDFDTWRERTHPDDLDPLKRGIEAFLADPTNGLEMQYRLRHADGSWRWFQALAAVMRNHAGHPLRVIGSVVDVSERKAQEQALREQEGRLRRLSRELLEAETQERRRLAGELHDRVGQNLTSLSLNLRALRRSLSLDDAACRRFEDSERLLEQTLAEVRTVMSELRPMELDDFGLFQSLASAARAAGSRGGFLVDVQGEEILPRLPAGEETAIYRIAQEAFSNVARHARASHMRLRLWQDPESVQLEVRDDGVGVPAPVLESGGGRGLHGMRERAHSLGAELVIAPAEGGGTRVSLRVPRS